MLGRLLAQRSQCTRLIDQLNAGHGLAKSFQTRDADALEHCASFLLHAYEEAKVAKLQVPRQLLCIIVERRALEVHLEAGADNRWQAAVSVIDAAVETPCGIKLVGDDADLKKEIQVTVACSLLKECCAQEDGVEQALLQLAGLLSNAINDKDLQTVFQHVKALASLSSQTEAEVRSAVDFFGNSHDGGRQEVRAASR